MDLNRLSRPLADPNTGKQVGDPDDPNAPMDLIWRYDARQNFFYMGPIPVFYWPRFDGRRRRPRGPAPQISFRSINYFGQQLLTDWNGFKVIGVKRPYNVDVWNLDLDYLSARTKEFPALGSEIGWFGRDLINDLTDPYHKVRNPSQSLTYDYFGYFDIWGLKDYRQRRARLGPGRRHPRARGPGKRGYQRSDVPPFQDIRGRFNIRHMQRFLPDDDEHHFEDLRLQLEDRLRLRPPLPGRVLQAAQRDRDGPGDPRLHAVSEEQLVVGPLGRGQPSDLQHRHPVAPPARLLPSRRLAASATGSPTTSTRASTTPTCTPT